jgi:pyruvate/2-oxoglutarate dehydrogenase complex dihydrolipoamide acyltransferase (E2) component
VETGDIDCTVTSFATQGVEEASPASEDGQFLALALGCDRVEPLWDGERFLPQAVATLTLAWDPAALGEGAAARFLARVHELVESPYALLAD